MNLLKNVVANVVVVILASLYLLTCSLVSSMRKVGDELQPIIGEVSLTRSILFMCIGICLVGFTGVFIALIR